MSYKITRIAVRQDPSTPFFEDANIPQMDEVVAYINTTYRDTGKLLSKTTTIDDANITCTTELVWVSAEAWNEFVSDQYLRNNFFIVTTQYEATNSIFSTFSAQ
jgi:hypothetical protein